VLDLLTTKLIEAAVGIAKDILGKRLQEINERLAKRKLDTEKRLVIEREKKRVETENENIRRENEKKAEDIAKGRQLKENDRKPKKLLTYTQPNLDNIRVKLEDGELAKGDFTVAVEELKHAARSHARVVAEWCRSVTFADMNEQRPISQVYVELDTFLTPRHLHVDNVESEARLPLLQTIYHSGTHSIVLGQPGAGKTTSMKKVFLDLLDANHDQKTLSVPILVRLRDLNGALEGKRSIATALGTIFPALATLELPADAPEDVADAEEVKLEVLAAFLDSFGCLVILDGFDEIALPSARLSVLAEYRIFAKVFHKSRLVLTCRTGDFKYQIDECRKYEIAPLDDMQIQKFALRWLGDPVAATRFIDAVRLTPFHDTAIRPLSLAHLCTLYKRLGKIPDRPKTVYRKIVALLLEDWDQQHENHRISRYGRFETDRKFEFLCHMAYMLTVEYKATAFSVDQMSQAYLKICDSFELPRVEMKAVIAELESHTGLIVQAGFELYEFAHKSLQEFLAAEYIVKLPIIPSGQSLKLLPNELAIAVSVSSNPSLYLSQLVIGTLATQRLSGNFYAAFVTRLCLERPSFTDHAEVILAAFTLITLAENGGRIPSVKDGAHRRSIPLIEKYKELFASLTQKNSLDILRAHYRPTTDQSHTGASYMKRVKALESFNLPAHLLIPEELCSQSGMRSG